MELGGGGFTVQIDQHLCKGVEGCSLCIWACPEAVIAPAERPGVRGVRSARVVGEEACTGCGSCMLYCPDLAVVVADGKGVVVVV